MTRTQPQATTSNEPPMTRDQVLALRDQLRALFARLGVTANVEAGTVGTRRAICVRPLSPADTQRLVQGYERPHETLARPL